jgi:hypothetical protein
MQINVYTVLGVLFLALCIYMPASCDTDMAQDIINSSQERHRAAMKDWAKTDDVPVTNPFEMTEQEKGRFR